MLRVVQYIYYLCTSEFVPNRYVEIQQGALPDIYISRYCKRHNSVQGIQELLERLTDNIFRMLSFYFLLIKQVSNIVICSRNVSAIPAA